MGFIENVVESTQSLAKFEVTELVSGGAQGVDSVGYNWAVRRNIPVKMFLPDYKVYWETPKLAPLARNEQMAIYADSLIAIWDGMSGGTANMIAHMQALDKPIYTLKAYYFETTSPLDTQAPKHKILKLNDFK